MKFKPNFSEYVKSEESILKAKLDGTRLAISHPGEKGKSIETEVMQYVRGFLPLEYGLGTGFIAYHSDDCVKRRIGHLPEYIHAKDEIKISTQIDIIIYDALRYSPIIKLNGCDVYPLEAVLGYIEVKSNLTSIRNCLLQARRLRKLQTRMYWGNLDPIQLVPVIDIFPVSIRSYIFALDADAKIGSHDKIVKYLERETKKLRSHISGMYIQGKGFFQNRPHSIARDKAIIDSFKPEVALKQFKIGLYEGLSNFPRAPKNMIPAMDLYFNKYPNMEPAYFESVKKYFKNKKVIDELNELIKQKKAIGLPVLR